MKHFIVLELVWWWVVADWATDDSLRLRQLPFIRIDKWTTCHRLSPSCNSSIAALSRPVTIDITDTEKKYVCVAVNAEEKEWKEWVSEKGLRRQCGKQWPSVMLSAFRWTTAAEQQQQKEIKVHNHTLPTLLVAQQLKRTFWNGHCGDHHHRHSLPPLFLQRRIMSLLELINIQVAVVGSHCTRQTKRCSVLLNAKGGTVHTIEWMATPSWRVRKWRNRLVRCVKGSLSTQ